MISKEDRRDDLVFVTVSDVGSSHRILSIPNQDSAAFICDGEDYVLAVSDGVGSCKHADQGSCFATHVCLKLFDGIKAHELPFEGETIAETLISQWKERITDNQFDEYCATVKAVFKLGNQVKIVSLGDGIAAISSDGIHMISPSEEVSFSNETKCLSSQVSPDSIWIGDYSLDTQKPYVIFCCTDGVANGIVQGQILNLIDEIEKGTDSNDLRSELESLVTEIGNYCFDDKTVGVVKYER